MVAHADRRAAAASQYWSRHSRNQQQQQHSLPPRRRRRHPPPPQRRSAHSTDRTLTARSSGRLGARDAQEDRALRAAEDGADRLQLGGWVAVGGGA